MKILFDHQCFWEKYGGVSKYFVEILKRLPTDQYILPVKFTNNEYIHELSNITTHRFFPHNNFRGKATLIQELGKLLSRPALKKGNFDIYHPTHYDCYGLDLISPNVKSVATIHDMNFFVIPEYYGKDHPLVKKQKEMAHRVDHIITISQNSKNDIIDTWHLPADKITVIYHGIDIEKINQSPVAKIPERYILFVGRRNSYKNFGGLLKAFSLLGNKYPDLNLYCAGMPLTSQESDEIARLGITNRVKTFQASDSMLYNLYRNALAFVFPSFYEGFGLPILEAMACGCPVVLSAASCFPEIAQDAAVYFDPHDINDMALSIDKVISDTDLQKTIVTRGNTLIRNYTWENSITQHLQVYNNLL